MQDEINTLLLTALPTNVLVEVASEICRMGGTCKRLYEISGNFNLWANYLPGVPLADKKAVFVQRCKISQNISRRVTIPFILQGHCDMILSLDVQGSNIVSASRDNTVKKWNIAKKKGVTYEGHSDWVVSAKFFDGGVISASADRSVRLWRDDGEECKMAKGHAAGVTCLKIVNPTVAATGSYDNTVKLWDLKAGKLISTFTDHASAVNCVDVLEGVMVSGTVLDGKIVLRDLQAGAVVRSFLVGNRTPGARVSLPNSNQLHSVLLARNVLFTGEAEKVRMWDLRAPNPQESIPVPPAESSEPQELEQPIPKHNTYKFTEKHSRGVFRMKHLEDVHWLLAGCMGLCGLTGFDLRSKKNQFYLKAHDYPILGMDARTTTMNDIAVTSGTTTNYRYEVAAYSITGQRIITKFAPSHQAVITSLRMGEEMIVSGAKDGSLVALTFNNYADKVRRSSSMTRIMNASAQMLRA